MAGVCYLKWRRRKIPSKIHIVRLDRQNLGRIFYVTLRRECNKVDC